MKYLITSIKDIEDILTPSLIAYDDDLLFNSFAFSKFEKQFRSCMKLRRIETFGEDFEKFPISFEEFNPKIDKFYGMDFDHLNVRIEIDEFKIDLIKYLNGYEDYLIEDITDQLPNPSEAEFKMFLHNCLKNIQNSHEFLVSLEIKNNAILNLVKDELIESHKRAFDKAKNYFSVYDEIFNKFKFETNLSNAELVENNEIDSIVSLKYIHSREEILKKLIGGSNNRTTFENFEKKLFEKKFLSKELDEWYNIPVNFIRFYTFCENLNLFNPYYKNNTHGVKLLRELYSIEGGKSLDFPSKRANIKSADISKVYYFLK